MLKTDFRKTIAKIGCFETRVTFNIYCYIFTQRQKVISTDRLITCLLKDEAVEDLEFQLEMTREAGAENLRQEREMRDEIQSR